MILTDKLVYVHHPKTGGTFVTEVLWRLHGCPGTSPAVRLTLRARLGMFTRGYVSYSNRNGRLTMNVFKHAGCGSIPATARDKIVLATVRNPYDHYVSEYEFGWWQRREYHKYYKALSGFDRRFPEFPNLSFAHYLELIHDALCLTQAADGMPRLGYLSESFVRFYFRRPNEVLPTIDDGYVDSAAYLSDMYDVCFIRMHRLNEELHQFLLRVGYDPAEVDFVRGLGKICPQGTARESHDWQRYYTPELKRQVRYRDRLLFAIFPEFDV
jgi:hypothetical protein